MATSYLKPPFYRFSKNLLDSVNGGLDDLSQSAMIGHTFVITPAIVNAFRLAANRVAVRRFNDDYFSGCDIGVKIYCFVPHQTVVNVTGGPVIGVGTAIQATFVPVYVSAFGNPPMPFRSASIPKLCNNSPILSTPMILNAAVGSGFPN